MYFVSTFSRLLRAFALAVKFYCETPPASVASGTSPPPPQKAEGDEAGRPCPSTAHRAALEATGLTVFPRLIAVADAGKTPRLPDGRARRYTRLIL